MGVMHFKKHLIFSAFVIMASCVQIPVGVEKSERFKQVDYKSPSSQNYKDISEDLSQGDRTWIHKKTGTLIGYKTECSSTQPSPQIYLESFLGGLASKEVKEEKSFSYNSREALRKKIAAKVEGIPTSLDLVAFNKYGCTFLLSQIGRSEGFSQSSSDFESFIKTFKVSR